MRIHLDTDLGGDPDDACALVMLLGWPEVEIVGVTTTIDPDGSRAGCAEHLLRLAGREDVPVVAGAAMSSTVREIAAPSTGDLRYWPENLPLRPSPAGAALDALERSIGLGATVVAIGPLTNLAILETVRPQALSGTHVVAMGGWVREPGEGLPAWGPEMDWNMQWDHRAAATVMAADCQLTLVMLTATLSAPLRELAVPRLRESGPLGRLLARQSEARAEDADMRSLGRAHARLPDDLLNFHYDPVACAVAAGWPGAVIETMRLAARLEGGVLRFVPDSDGRPVRVVTAVDGEAFAEDWLAAVEVADASR